MSIQKKEKILVVVPYGMCFRNVVLNNHLWNYLKANFSIDIFTPLVIKEQDKKRIAVRKVYNYEKYKLFSKYLINLNRKIHGIRKYMDLSDFFLKNSLGWPLVGRYHVNFRCREDLSKDLFFWPAIKRTKIGKFFKKIIRFFPLFHPYKRILKKNNYKFIIITHNAEPECVITAQIANRLKIPVVCIPLGLDNILHDSMLFFPDLMLLWGKEQKQEFEKIQIPWNEKLKQTKLELVGCLIYDNYLNLDNEKKYLNEKIILFPAYIEDYCPGQTDICKTVIKFIKDNNLKTKLLIRVRPGFDVEMWKRFQKDNPNYVILQFPQGVSFDKSSKTQIVNIDQEIEDIKIFSTTFRNSSLVIIPALSTTYTDSLALGTSSIIIGYSPRDGSREESFKNYFGQALVTYPHWGWYNIAFKEEELINFMRKNLLIEEIINISEGDKNLLFNQAFLVDGKAGERAVEAIKRFLAER